MKYLVILVYLCLSSAWASPVRNVRLQQDELLTVYAATGIATIIQSPETIQSVVIGDQSAFKVEYLDKAITIKPLRYGARTNLYLITASTRYNLRLQTVGQERADFIVYIKGRENDLAPNWVGLRKRAASAGVSVSLSRLGRSKNGVLVLDGAVSSEKAFKLTPKDFWLFQGDKSVVIDSLFLTSLEASKGKDIRFGLAVRESNLSTGRSVALKLFNVSPITIQITEREWKK